MSKSRLQELRKTIDEIDEQIITAVSERIKIAEELADLKKKLKMDAKDETRERAVISRVREKSKELGLDQDFAESLIRFVVAKTWGKQKERLKSTGIWPEIKGVFKDYPAQLNVIQVLFRYGLRVREDGEIACGNMKVPSVQVAAEAGVDRRVVDATTQRILKDKKLKDIFENLEPITYLKGVAHHLGLGVIEIIPEDAARPGIIKEVTEVISKFNISIRQTVADDPHFAPQPKLTIITDEPVHGPVLEALRKLPSVRSIIIY
jgi:hypothetical protein